MACHFCPLIGLPFHINVFGKHSIPLARLSSQPWSHLHDKGLRRFVYFDDDCGLTDSFDKFGSDCTLRRGRDGNHDEFIRYIGAVMHWNHGSSGFS